MKLLKLLVGLVLLYALFRFGILDLRSIALVAERPWLFALAVLLLFGTVPVQSLRWHLLLGALGLRIRFAKTTQIVLASAFFNAFLPGGYGGDLVRATYVFRAAQRQRASALLSLVIDRLTGLAGLLTLGVAVSVLHPLESTGLSGVALHVTAAAFVLGNAVLVLYGHRMARFVAQRFPGRLARLAAGLDDVSNALETYLRRWPHLVAAWALSLLLFAMSIAGLLLVVAILRIGSLSMAQYTIAGVWSILVNSLPVTPGGIGVGESAFAQLSLRLETVASGAPYATVFLVYRATTILATVPGVIAYLTYRQELIAYDAAHLAPRASASRDIQHP